MATARGRRYCASVQRCRPGGMSRRFTLLPQHALQSLAGGLQPPAEKSCSTQRPIGRLPLAERLVIPLQQHAGPAGQLLVQVGQQLPKGAPLTQGFDARTLPVHASAAGYIRAIRPYVDPRQPSRTLPPPLCIELHSDGQPHEQILPPRPNYTDYPATILIEQIMAAGVAGLGGAGFPSTAKWPSRQHPPLQLLIINAMECEPYITADDALMREQAAAIIQGCHILQHILAPQQSVLAIEDNKPQALAALQQALAHSPTPGDWLQWRVLPSRYPSGDARQLIRLLTGSEVPQGAHSQQQGVLVQNVATLFALQQAIVVGKPLTERVVTLTGDAIAQPGNFWLPLGTPIAHLLQQAGITDDRQALQISIGGSMMGVALRDRQAPITKTTNCLLVRHPPPVASRAEQPCIRCGDCATVCPVGLLPQQLYWYSRGQQHVLARAHHLLACIECGACDAVCPSHIPLVHYYQQEKAQLRALDQQAQQAQQAKMRWNAKQQRLAQQQQARQQQRVQLAAAPPLMADRGLTSDQPAATPDSARPTVQSAPPAATASAARQAAVAAALARAKARQSAKSAPTPPQPLGATDA